MTESFDAVLAEMDALAAKIAGAGINGFGNHVADLRNRLQSAHEAEVAELRADARRYRWMKQWDVGIDHEGGSDWRWWAYAEGTAGGGLPGLDAVVDAAMKESAHED